MTEVHRIIGDLSRQMVAEGYPVHCAMDCEAMLLSFLANQGRKAKAEADAAKALARGWRSAAECQGVHPATVYRRAHRFSRKTRELAKG
jgi:hypothetical protein